MITDILGKDEFLPHNKLIEYFAKYGCDINILEHEICSNILFALFGFDKSQFNYVCRNVYKLLILNKLKHIYVSFITF